MQTLKPSIAL